MTKKIEKAYCRHCNFELDWNHTGPCPKCGKQGKVGVLQVFEKKVVSDSIRIEHEVKRKKKNPLIFYIILVVTFVVSFFGYYVGGVLGLVVGIIGGALTLVFSEKAIWIEKFKSTYEKK